MTTVASDTGRARFFASLKALSTRDDGPILIAIEGMEESTTETRRFKRESSWHRHVRGQFVCIDNGLVHMRTEGGSWLLPPRRAGWIPPGVYHQAISHGVTSTIHMFVAPAAAQMLPPEPSVMGVNELARSLMQRAASWTFEEKLQPRQRRILNVLLDELRHAPRDPMHLPMPTDRRLRRIADAILEAPSTARSLEELASTVGISPRTAHRLFDAELGMSFARWRQHAMLVEAVRRMALGESVANVADALGYASPSNFIAMFKRHFGDSPARYLSRQATER